MPRGDHRALAIEVAQRTFVDVAERERRHQFLDDEMIAIQGRGRMRRNRPVRTAGSLLAMFRRRRSFFWRCAPWRRCGGLRCDRGRI